MGQALPLPERVPRPLGTQSIILERLGFKTHGDGPYVVLELPEGYSWSDRSSHADLPDWYVMKDGIAYIRVNGTWKGTYDNDLYMRVYEEGTTDITPLPDTEPAPCETSGAKMTVRFIEAMDP